uniref:Uncharacterized protein n=1 Tax=Oryza brachyantha TaxID=4533 RepID=J3MEH8_ORYBR
MVTLMWPSSAKTIVPQTLYIARTRSDVTSLTASFSVVTCQKDTDVRAGGVIGQHVVGHPDGPIDPVPSTDLAQPSRSSLYNHIDVMPLERYIPTTKLVGGNLLALMQ